MIRNLSHIVVAAVVLLLPAQLVAGGPPFLCLPVDGVNSENVAACTKLLNSKLEEKFWTHSGRPHGVKLTERANQWYLAFYMGGDVRLSEVQAALEGSEFSIPRDRLQMFGHVILEIDSPLKSRDALLAGLKALPHVSVEDSKKAQKDLLFVTLDMPYPADMGREDLESVGWEKFQRNDFNSTPSTQPKIPVTAGELPGYEDVQGVVSKNRVSLKDIHWSANHACRVLGCVVEPRPSAQDKPKTPAAVR